MKRLIKFNALAMIVLAIVLMGNTTFAGQLSNTETDQDGKEYKWRGQRHGHRGMRHGFMHKLGLTDAQKEQIKQIHQNHRDSLKPLVQELRAKKQELHEASQGTSYNESLVAQKLTEMATIKAKLMGEKFKIRQETLSILTPEQKTQLEQMKEQFKNRRQERRQNFERKSKDSQSF